MNREALVVNGKETEIQTFRCLGIFHFLPTVLTEEGDRVLSVPKRDSLAGDFLFSAGWVDCDQRTVDRRLAVRAALGFKFGLQLDMKMKLIILGSLKDLVTLQTYF